MSRFNDNDQTIRFGADASQGIEEVRKYRAEIDTTRRKIPKTDSSTRWSDSFTITGLRG